jgi:hypothetical protein
MSRIVYWIPFEPGSLPNGQTRPTRVMVGGGKFSTFIFRRDLRVKKRGFNSSNNR